MSRTIAAFLSEQSSTQARFFLAPHSVACEQLTGPPGPPSSRSAGRQGGREATDVGHSYCIFGNGRRQRNQKERQGKRDCCLTVDEDDCLLVCSLDLVELLGQPLELRHRDPGIIPNERKVRRPVQVVPRSSSRVEVTCMRERGYNIKKQDPEEKRLFRRYDLQVIICLVGEMESITCTRCSKGLHNDGEDR